MSINKLIVGGFKSIREQTEIPIAPLTFLFGPNSAGKSTVLAALDSLAERLIPKKRDDSSLSLNLIAMFEGFGTPGAHQLPRQEDGVEPTRTAVILGLVIDDFSAKTFTSGEVQSDAQRIALDLFNNLAGTSVGMVFVGSTPKFLSRVAVNGIQLLELTAAAPFLTSNPGAVALPDLGSIVGLQDSSTLQTPGWGALTIHAAHPFWRETALAKTLNELRTAAMEASPSFVQQALSISDETIVIRTPVSPLHAEHWGNFAVAQRSLMDICLHGVANESDAHQRLRKGFLKILILVDLICASVNHFIERVRKAAHQELQFARVPGDRKILTADDLKTEFLFPVRRDLRGPHIDDYAAWLGVLCAKEVLLEEDSADLDDILVCVGEHDDLVNDTLGLDLFPGRGYRVKPEVWQATNKLLLTADPLEGGGSHRMLEVSLSLEDANGRILSFAKVGSGVSYVMPVLVSLWGAKRSWIEQPELHLHPAAQCEMGDVIIRAFNRGRFSIIETHSEHLLLRVLRRIRQTSKGPTDDPELRCHPEAVSILYFDPMHDGSTKVRPIRVSRSGDFLDRWPHGFFAERDQELFDE